MTTSVSSELGRCRYFEYAIKVGVFKSKSKGMPSKGGVAQRGRANFVVRPLKRITKPLVAGHFGGEIIPRAESMTRFEREADDSIPPGWSDLVGLPCSAFSMLAD